MVDFALGNYFLAPSFITWFWILIPFLILYLIKPKPVNQSIPSLMFLIQDKGSAFRNSFFRYLFRDFVFLLQLLILALLIAAACRPYATVPKTALVNNAVIVIDGSASMQTEDGRWDDAIDYAKDSLAWQNTVILVLNRPVVLGTELSKGEAEDILDSLQPSATETNLYSAIIAARQYAPDADTTVTVISDFRNTDSQQDYTAAIKTVQASGATVQLQQVGGAAQNIGIVSLDVKEERTRVGITNFMDESKVVTLKAGSFEQAVPLGPGATDYVTINTPIGTTEVKLDVNDDFPLDDRAYIVNHDDLGVDILIVTNDLTIRNTPFWYGLQAINDQTPLELRIDVNNPPTLVNVDHDIIIFKDVSPTLLVQRTVRDAKANTEQGNAVIIMYQDDLFGINFEGLLPYEYQGKGGATAVVGSEFSSLVSDIDFGDVQHYSIITGTGRELAEASADGSPMIGLHSIGNGQALYYGIDDKVASFPVDTKYPVFWKRMLDELGGRESLEKLNYKTGATPLNVRGEPRETPNDAIYMGFLDQQGIYRFEGRSVAANLLSQEESRVSVEPLESLRAAQVAESGGVLKEKELTPYLIMFLIFLLFLELFIVKFRGDF
jgi:hypothetical protein